ncbi:MAG: anthranilate synthase component I family protein, partial [Patescibacteria group bacterium]|nr:anthranilate synthase component I family protein [Patescibacteria group bacterium]
MIKVIPIYQEIKIKESPELIYKKLQTENSYLLESAEGSEKLARYSFIGFEPVVKLIIKDRKSKLEVFDSNLRNLKIIGPEPVEILKNLLSQFEFKGKSLARFAGGFVGYFSYDLVRYFFNLEGRARDDLKEPDCEFVLTKNNLIFDHKKRKAYLFSFQFLFPDEKINGKIIFNDFEKILKKISSFQPFALNKNRKRRKNNFSFNISKTGFKENLKKAKKYISAGDIFQVVLSQRLETNFKCDKFLIYQNLKRINPSPYMYYLDFGQRKVIGSSPEMLVRVEKRKIETYPIAGTRPRRRNLDEDKKLEREMLEDEKEKAEHIMLVDLARNDLGKVAKFGSVKVEKLMAVEKYSHVQHLISKVSGELRKGEDEFSAFKAIFPAGTVSGAPKVRAMEIIDELEPTKR